MWKKVKQVLNWILDVIYPPFCLRCGKMGEFLCDNCYSHLNFVMQNDLAPALFARSEEPVYLQKVQAMLVYDELVKKILHHYKYLGGRDLYKPLAYWLYEYMGFEADVITFIPVHRKRFRERGYNQSQLLAQELSRLSGIPCAQLLSRPVYREKQALSKSKAERLSKTKNIFAAVPTALDKKQKVLLIDDVVTSGATLNEAARVLTEAGFGQVSALAVAHGD